MLPMITHTYILLDRSGSMSMRWAETVSAINAYVDELSEAGRLDTLITVCGFDAYRADDPILLDMRRATRVRDWKAIEPDEVRPRGNTPLFDAVRDIIVMAEKDAPEKAVLLIVTDGEENASRKTTKEHARELLNGWRARDWASLFIGADFDAFADAASLNYAQGATISTHNVGDTLRSAGAKNVAFYASAHATADVMDWNEQDRAVAAAPKKSQGDGWGGLFKKLDEER